MTRKSRREIENELEDLRGGDQSPGLVIIGDHEDSDYLTAGEFEDRHGHPPAESDALVIHVPEEAEGY